MCGIAGIFSPNAPLLAGEEIQNMIRMIGYRGPDELCYYTDNHAALAAARLSIIDLAGGRQPMVDPSGRYWIIYNGETYNYREIRTVLQQRGHVFRTACDTEVVLHAWIEWKDDAPRRFDGGFAFAIYDRVEKSCTLVRDRFGKRPLYYAYHRGALIFASEMKAFLACDGFQFEWNPDQLASIFTIWTPIGDQTGFQGIKQVPSGSISRFSIDGASLETTYAGLPQADPIPGQTFSDTAQEVREKLDGSLKLRLRSDVEVAVFVSGGLDSAIVTKLARDRLPSRLRTYSISFADTDFDESADQKAVADWFGLDNRSITVHSDTIASTFAEAMWHAEVPQFRTAFVPMFLLAERVRADEIKVVLSGEGADEVFLGYDLFKETKLRAAWPNLDQQRRRERLKGLYPYLQHFSDENMSALAALFGRTSADSDAAFFSHKIRFENSNLALRLLQGKSAPLNALEEMVSTVTDFGAFTPVRRAQWLEFYTLLQGYLLSTQSDRMLFARGVEPRCPFLDPAVIEHAASLPTSFLLSPEFDEKHVLKAAFRDDLPSQILSKPKWPYRAPDVASFFHAAESSRQMSEWAADTLSAGALEKVGPLNPQMARRLVDRVSNTPTCNLSPRENQAFILLLSLSVLDELFVRRAGQQRYAPARRHVHRVSHKLGR